MRDNIISGSFLRLFCKFQNHADHLYQISPAISAEATATIPITTISASIAPITASIAASVSTVATVDRQSEGRVEGERPVEAREAAASDFLEVTCARGHARQGSQDDQDEQQLRGGIQGD